MSSSIDYNYINLLKEQEESKDLKKSLDKLTPKIDSMIWSKESIEKMLLSKAKKRQDKSQKDKVQTSSDCTVVKITENFSYAVINKEKKINFKPEIGPDTEDTLY